MRWGEIRFAKRRRCQAGAAAYDAMGSEGVSQLRPIAPV